MNPISVFLWKRATLHVCTFNNNVVIICLQRIKIHVFMLYKILAYGIYETYIQNDIMPSHAYTCICTLRYSLCLHRPRYLIWQLVMTKSCLSILTSSLWFASHYFAHMPILCYALTSCKRVTYGDLIMLLPCNYVIIIHIFMIIHTNIPVLIHHVHQHYFFTVPVHICQ